MFAVIAAILFAIGLVLHIMHQSEYTIEIFWLAGLLSLALALVIPAVPGSWWARR